MRFTHGTHCWGFSLPHHSSSACCNPEHVPTRASWPQAVSLLGQGRQAVEWQQVGGLFTSGQGYLRMTIISQWEVRWDFGFWVGECSTTDSVPVFLGWNREWGKGKWGTAKIQQHTQEYSQGFQSRPHSASAGRLSPKLGCTIKFSYHVFSNSESTCKLTYNTFVFLLRLKKLTRLLISRK